MSNRRWYVRSPDYEYIEPVPGFSGQGPTYTTCDVVEVLAPNRREAIRAGVAIMLHAYPDGWARTQRGDGACPYTGVQAERVTR